MSERGALPLLPHPLVWVMTVVAAAASGMLAVGLFCLIGVGAALIKDAVPLNDTLVVAAMFWLPSLLPTVVGAVLMQVDLVDVGSLVDASRPRFGLCWAEWERGQGLMWSSRLRTPEPAEGQPDVGGFSTRHSDRSWLTRDLLRAFAGGLCSTLALTGLLLMLWPQVSGNATLAIYLGYSLAPYLLLSVLPVTGLVAAWRFWWQTGRAQTWTRQVVLEGNVLRTDQGEFHFRDPQWSMELEHDAYGATLALEDRDQELRFRAPWADLLWVEQQLRAVKPVEGNTEDVPLALRQLQHERGRT